MKEFGENTYKNTAMEKYMEVDPDSIMGEYLPNSMAIMVPTLGMIHWRVVQSWEYMRFPMNCKKIRVWAEGKEVGKAYEAMLKNFLSSQYSDFKFILTMEDDNIPERDALVKLLDGIYTCIDCEKQIDPVTWHCPDGHKGLDGISGLYFSKGGQPTPLCFGDPSDPDDGKPIDVRDAIRSGGIAECNIIPNGFGLFRVESIKQMSEPRFLTLNGGQGIHVTQDIYFCRKAKEEIGARFAVHCGAKVGHIDTRTGRIY